MRALLLALTALAASPAGASVVYDLAGDWSDTANPNSEWAYRQGTALLPSQANWLAGSFAGAQPGWAFLDVFGPGHVPVMFKTASAPSFPSDFVVGDVIVHAADQNALPLGLANITWTSPDAGTIDIDGSVWLARNSGRSSRFNLYLNSTLLASGDVFDGDAYSRASPLGFSSSGLSVDTGDVVMIEILRPGNTSAEFTGVNLRIELTESGAVPEPSTMVLTAAAGVLLMVRRIKRTNP